LVLPTGTKGPSRQHLTTEPLARDHQPGLKPYLVPGAEIAETKGILDDRRKVSCVVVRQVLQVMTKCVCTLATASSYHLDLNSDVSMIIIFLL
jgi:hypothetical protein